VKTPNLKLSHKALILIAVPLTFQVIFVSILGWLTLESEGEAQSEIKSKTILDCADRVAGLAEDAGFTLLRYTKDKKNQRHHVAYLKIIDQVKTEMDKLDGLTAHDPGAHDLVAKAESLLDDEIKIGSYVIASLNSDVHVEQPANSPQKIELYEISRQLLATVHELAERGQKESELTSQHHFRGIVLPILAVGVLLNICLAIALALYFNAGTTRRLKVMMDNSFKFAAGELGIPLSGHDELAHLDNGFRQMAAALSEAARKERAIIENAVDVICSIDEKLCFMSVSASAADVFGLTDEQIRGTKLAALFAREDFSQVVTAFNKVKSNPTEPYFENTIKRRDGSRADIRWSVQWSPHERSYYCIASDITARRELERMRHEFVSMMSHDLRTPLTSVQASLTLLSEGVWGDLSEPANKSVLSAERNINYIVSLINSLIDVERLESGLISVKLSTIDLAEVVEIAIDTVGNIAHNTGIKIANEVGHLNLPGDSSRLLQVVINILSNALKFSPKGSTITLRTVIVEGYVELQIEDQGRGIPAEQCDNVFDRFKQVYKSDSEVQMGSGLGLAICKSIVEGHGGTIGVRSDLGKGSTFWIRLPMESKSAVMNA
jgi:PAS domain S-box-containing protein